MAIFQRQVLLGLVLGVMLTAASAGAASKYDGNWSVSIITEQGSCDPGYRYRIRIVNGQLSYDEPSGPPLRFSGKVGDNGQINVSVTRGSQQVNGTGRLSGSSGAGRWSGQSSTDKCSGRWEAERRGA